jgi:response regulator RpfG family c-di-GMP phosphodiesterase/serine/threonine protein kinase
MSDTIPLSSVRREANLPDASSRSNNRPTPAFGMEPAVNDATPPPTASLPSSTKAFLDQVVNLRLLSPSTADRFLHDNKQCIAEFSTAQALGKALVKAGLLTDYQIDRIQVGTTHGLVLGNYHVLERIGSGGMSYVFLAEHNLMKRRVAIKVLPVDDDCPSSIRHRFYAEMRVLADLHHPNVVMAYDAGELPAPGNNLPTLTYLVMELVSGGDLEQIVLDKGPRPIAQACDWVRQAACGLQEAHDHHLIHRDIKPSNILLTTGGQVKVVDFGLARQFCSKLTDPRALLGSVEFMAPEQSYDPSSVGGEADIYGLGATLFWLLTGEAPFRHMRSVGAALRALQQEPPRRLRQLRPEASEELDALVDRMLARDPRQRPTLPLAVMNALAPYATGCNQTATALSRSSSEFYLPAAEDSESTETTPPPSSIGPESNAQTGNTGVSLVTDGLGRRVLLVDDDLMIRDLCRRVLQAIGCEVGEVESGRKALDLLCKEPYDLVLLDVGLPDMDGYEVCRRLRERSPRPNLKMIVVSGRGDQETLAEALAHGADDYVPKPFSPGQLEAKVVHALRLKQAQDRTHLLAQQLMMTNQQLEHSLEARVADVRQAQDALLFGMAKMAESREGETPGHLLRLQRYCRVLAKQVANIPPWYGMVDTRFLEQIDRCVPLHDIGKIGLPDEILLKTGPLSGPERTLVETHPVIGDRILETLGREHGTALEFLGTARGIVRSHHERWDGSGYPDHLAGEAIPAAARLVALADVYDALRRQRPHKPALPHSDAARVILEQSPGQFDPALVRAFGMCQIEFARIYRVTGG